MANTQAARPYQETFIRSLKFNRLATPICKKLVKAFGLCIGYHEPVNAYIQRLSGREVTAVGSIVALAAAQSIENLEELENALAALIQQTAVDYIKQINGPVVPPHLDTFNEGHYLIGIARTPDSWFSTVSYDKPYIRLLNFYLPLQVPRGSVIEFEHHPPLALTAGVPVMFPISFTHNYKFKVEEGKELIALESRISVLRPSQPAVL